MIHVTLNTGHTVEQSLADIGEAAVQVLRPLVAAVAGSLPAPFGAFRVEITRGDGGAVFTVSRAREPIVTCGVAWTAPGAAEIWPAVEGLYLGVSDAFTAAGINAEPVEPDRLPWLAVVLLPALMAQSRADVGWLGDFERCMAVALMDSANR